MTTSKFRFLIRPTDSCSRSIRPIPVERMAHRFILCGCSRPGCAHEPEPAVRGSGLDAAVDRTRDGRGHASGLLAGHWLAVWQLEPREAHVAGMGVKSGRGGPVCRGRLVAGTAISFHCCLPVKMGRVPFADGLAGDFRVSLRARMAGARTLSELPAAKAGGSGNVRILRSRLCTATQEWHGNL